MTRLPGRAESLAVACVQRSILIRESGRLEHRCTGFSGSIQRWDIEGHADSIWGARRLTQSGWYSVQLLPPQTSIACSVRRCRPCAPWRGRRIESGSHFCKRTISMRSSRQRRAWPRKSAARQVSLAMVPVWWTKHSALGKAGCRSLPLTV